MPKVSSFRERLIEKIRIDKRTGCWNWVGSRDRAGYGLIYRPNYGKRVRANRASYEEFVGPLGPKEFALHTCDNKSCICPDHLYKDSKSQNAIDYVIRQGHHLAVLNPKKVRAIRKLLETDMTQRNIAAKFGVHFSIVSKIKYRKLWGHVS